MPLKRRKVIVFIGALLSLFAIIFSAGATGYFVRYRPIHPMPDTDWIYPIYDHGRIVYGTRLDQGLTDGLLPAILIAVTFLLAAVFRPVDH
jgi:hypothetical protein